MIGLYFSLKKFNITISQTFNFLPRVTQNKSENLESLKVQTLFIQSKVCKSAMHSTASHENKGRNERKYMKSTIAMTYMMTPNMLTKSSFLTSRNAVSPTFAIGLIVYSRLASSQTRMVVTTQLSLCIQTPCNSTR